MAAHQRRRHARASATGTLPSELLLEIAARSDDVATLFRCAAACKLLRREIASPDFVGRVCEAPGDMMPPRLLGFLDWGFSLVHPTTSPAAESFAENHLVPFVSRSAGDLLHRYEALTSRGGLVLLERRQIFPNQDLERASDDMCVYDPMTGDRTFLHLPPDIDRKNRDMRIYKYVLLTAADGIGCSYLLLAVQLDRLRDCSICVRTASSDTSGQWSPVSHVGNPGPPPLASLVFCNDPATVVLGGVVHFLVRGYVVTYEVAGKAMIGMIQLPKDCDVAHHLVHIGLTPDGNLRVFAPIRGFTLSFWVLSGGSWSQRVDVDAFATLHSLVGWWRDESEEDDDDDDFEEFCSWYSDCVRVEGIGDQRSGVVFLRLPNSKFLFDMDTADVRRRTRRVGPYGVPYMVDLSSRLSTMKMF